MLKENYTCIVDVNREGARKNAETIIQREKDGRRGGLKEDTQGESKGYDYSEKEIDSHIY